MKILTVTDAWRPQVNGVVRTIEVTNAELERAGHQTALITPADFRTIPCPGYSEIRLSLLPGARVAAAIEAAAPDAVHLATEGPLGQAARRYCLRRGAPFTTAYHTRFPQYVHAMYGVPEPWVYRFLRWFHGPAARVLAPTPTVEAELNRHGLANTAIWTRGVNTDVFRPLADPPSPHFDGTPGPRFLYVGRVSVEKNVEAFLQLDLPGTKIVAGIGPALDGLKRRFPSARFVGVLPRDELARLYSSADVFVFPSRTDTFGLVLLEALACGTPVAAFPVQGPLDVVGASVGGAEVAVLDADLRKAALAAVGLSRDACRRFALGHSWKAATEQFLALQARIAPSAAAAAVALG